MASQAARTARIDQCVSSPRSRAAAAPAPTAFGMRRAAGETAACRLDGRTRGPLCLHNQSHVGEPKRGIDLAHGLERQQRRRGGGGPVRLAAVDLIEGAYGARPGRRLDTSCSAQLGLVLGAPMARASTSGSTKS